MAILQKENKSISPVFFLIGIFTISLLLFAVIELLRDQLYFVVSASNYLLFHNVIEVFSIITSISIFSVGLLTNRQSRDERIIFLSYAFLGIGLLDLMHVLSFPGMPDFITPSSTNKGILFWISARLLSACAFIISAIIFKNPIRFKFWKQWALMSVILSVLAVFFSVIFYEHSLPAMFVEGTGLTPLKIYLEYITIGLFIISYIAYLRRFLETKEKVFLLYLAAITISIFSELAFTLYKSAYDIFNLLGHLYKFIAFCFIYAGIFSVSVKIPYKKLLELATELKNDIIARKRAEKYSEKLISSANAMIVGLDIDGKVTIFNETAERITGYRKNEVMGRNWFELVVPRSRYPETWKIFEKFQKQGKSITGDFENPIITKSGEERIIEWRNSDLKNNGNVIGTISYGIDITERKRAERILKDSATRLNEAQHIGHIGSWELNLKNNVLTWSDEIYKIFEIDQKKFGATYEAFLNTIHPDDRKAVDDAYVKSLKTKTAYSIDHRLLLPGNRIKYVHERCETFYDKSGKPLRSAGTVQDITERKKAEESLLKNKEELNKAQVLGRIGNWDWDMTTDIITWSDEYYRIFNFDPKKHPPKYEEHLKVYTSESAARLDAAAKRNIQTGEPYELDLEIANPNGPTRWITARSETKCDSQGKIIGLRGTAQDITERKSTEIELNRANHALKMLSETNEALIHISTEVDLLNKFCQIAVNIGNYPMIWIGFVENDETKIIRPVASAGFENGYLNKIDLTWADDENGQGPDGIAIRAGKQVIVHDIIQNPLLISWKNAAIKQNCKSVIALPLINQGEVFGIINIYSSELNAFSDKETAILKEIADDLAFGIATLRMRGKVEERTKELDQLKNKFILIVSHQLRTPLTNIRWQLERLLGGKHDHLNAIQEELVQSSYNEDLEIISRINDLVTALDIEEKKEIYLDKNPNYLRNLWKSVEINFSENCKIKKIKYKKDFSDAPVALVNIDTEKIRTVFEKLADNAVTYTKENGEIIVSIKKTGDNLLFKISDNGVGIPEAEKQFIFTRFFRASNSIIMKPDSSGLGLYISKHIIEAHGGKIAFESKEGIGTTFWFEIPIKK